MVIETSSIYNTTCFLNLNSMEKEDKVQVLIDF